MPVKSAFLCHSSGDSEFVVQIGALLAKFIERVFCYEKHQKADGSFIAEYNAALREANGIVIFLNDLPGHGHQFEEIQIAARRVAEERPPPAVVIVPLRGSAPDGGVARRIADLPLTFPQSLSLRSVVLDHCDHDGNPVVTITAQKIAQALSLTTTWDGLPFNPYLFDDEKAVIDFYRRKRDLGSDAFSPPGVAVGTAEVIEEASRQEVRTKLLQGAPPHWPTVVDLSESDPQRQLNPLHQDQIGSYRPRQAKVSAAPTYDEELCFPVAGPCGELLLPRIHRSELKVAIVVSGGIAPGINAAIDGIVQRHWLYAGHPHNPRYQLEVLGLLNGFRSFVRQGLANNSVHLVPDGSHTMHFPTRATGEHASKGGSIIGTFRLDELQKAVTRGATLARIASDLETNKVDILYVIGGDGGMKAAHAIWTMARERAIYPTSVVTIPKTMDNDILWISQGCGFASAVQMAKDFIEHLHTEVESNPRLCIVQLFGSDSGFVVSHAVLATAPGQCKLALIPEVPFSLLGIAYYLKRLVQQAGHVPFGLVVLGETAIPEDATYYIGLPERPPPVPGVHIHLDELEQAALLDFYANRQQGRRIEGQTSDKLRTAGVKIVAQGLDQLLRNRAVPDDPGHPIDWNDLRIVTNEPRHLVRAVAPSTSDIIMGQRLGTLAVDNALAGYTDFMISQRSSEYVMVPLPLVVLGRRRVLQDGIFWKSVRAKTGQPANLVSPWRPPQSSPAL